MLADGQAQAEIVEASESAGADCRSGSLPLPR